MNRGLCRFVSDELEFVVVIMTVHMKCALANLTECKQSEETYLVGVSSECLNFLRVIHKRRVLLFKIMDFN
jgi:hypothetical protein